MKKSPTDAFGKWNDELEWRTLTGRKGKSVRGVRLAKPQRQSAGGSAIRDKIQRIVRRVPEVVVKISGNGKNVAHIKAHMDYISRNGQLELEDENGQPYLGKPDVRDLSDIWGMGRYGIPYEGERRKESYNIVLSMPPGTNPAGLRAAARDFATHEFGERQFVFALHDDKDHTHVHLVVKSADARGARLNPRKADLRRWREHFAEHLREHGIEANASSRKARGVVRRPESQIVRQIADRGAQSYVRAGQVAEAAQEAQGGPQRVNPAQGAIKTARRAVTSVYGDVARTLAAGDDADKALALAIVKFVRDMPPPTSQHEARVEQLRAGPAGTGRTGGQQQEKGREPDSGGRDRG